MHKKTELMLFLVLTSYVSSIQVPKHIKGDCLYRLQNYEHFLLKKFDPTVTVSNNLESLWENLNRLKILQNQAKLIEIFQDLNLNSTIPRKTNGTYFGFAHFEQCLQSDLSKCAGLKGDELISCLKESRVALQKTRYMDGWAPIAEGIMTKLEGVETAVDFGSGRGNFLAAMYQHGLKLGVGIEPSFHGNLCYFQNGWNTTEKLPIQVDAPIGSVSGDGNVENLMCYLSGEKYMKFDVVMTFEVFEHIPRQAHCSLLNFMAGMASRWVVSSIAHPGQPGLQHIASREKEDWINEWRVRGFTYRRDLTEEFTSRTALSFAKDNTVVLESLGEIKEVSCSM
eukprot:TRINITY_DN1751_c0_g1_i6.p1 TRINITY_DN1751_c0_g1~~TRINITY_DN1751_c0_g1_i6.p1  ORF type:complete len:339 (-),score=26.75 TRINITY_DN1751_c0_g1_i6:434-1450(-)